MVFICSPYFLPALQRRLHGTRRCAVCKLGRLVDRLRGCADRFRSGRGCRSWRSRYLCRSAWDSWRAAPPPTSSGRPGSSRIAGRRFPARQAALDACRRRTSPSMVVMGCFDSADTASGRSAPLCRSGGPCRRRTGRFRSRISCLAGSRTSRITHNRGVSAGTSTVLDCPFTLSLYAMVLAPNHKVAAFPRAAIKRKHPST